MGETIKKISSNMTSTGELVRLFQGTVNSSFERDEYLMLNGRLSMA